MYEKVNPSHPDKIADRIAGALVDLAYKKAHDDCHFGSFPPERKRAGTHTTTWKSA